MDITGKIIAVLDPRSGVSASTGNSWMSQEYVIETHDQYPRKCCFNIFGEDRIKQFNIQIGQELTVSFDINAREYNGRWYNDIRAWAVRPADLNPMAAPAAPIPAPSDAPAAPAAGVVANGGIDPLGGGDSGDDLPF